MAASTGFRGAKAAGGVRGFCKFRVSGGRAVWRSLGLGGVRAASLQGTRLRKLKPTGGEACGEAGAG